HVGQELGLDQLALSYLGAALGAAAMGAKRCQFRGVAGTAAGPEPAVQEAMDGEVGITADWRGEVAIVFTGQRKMPFFLGTVSCLLQASKHGVMNSINLGAAGGLLQDTLQGKAVGFALDFVAENPGELGKGLEFVRLRRRVNAAQKRHAET